MVLSSHCNASIKVLLPLPFFPMTTLNGCKGMGFGLNAALNRSSVISANMWP